MGITDTAHVVSLFVRPSAPGRELWTWDTWRTISQALSPWVSRPEIVETRSHQNHRDTKKAVTFPEELRWTESSFAVWTHGSPETALTSARWSFGSTNLCAPAWSACVHADESPSVYVEVKSRPFDGRSLELLLVSLSVEVLGDEHVPSGVRDLWAELSPRDVDGPRLAAWTVRPFLRRRHTAFVRSVDEITHSELDRTVSLEALQHESESMDRRCRVTSEPWRALSEHPRDVR